MVWEPMTVMLHLRSEVQNQNDLVTQAQETHVLQPYFTNYNCPPLIQTTSIKGHPSFQDRIQMHCEKLKYY